MHLLERIMFPEVPLALRMSSHLLLGVVRIYSKKVEYLYRDCNILWIEIRKAFSSIQVYPPEGATHAPFHSITLPDTFELDALDLGADLSFEGVQDIHIWAEEEITRADYQIPIGKDPYIAVSCDENSENDPSPSREIPDSGVGPTDEDVGPSFPAQDSVGRNEENNPEQVIERENFRDADPDSPSEIPRVWIEPGNNATAPQKSPEKSSNEEENCPPNVPNVSNPGRQSPPLPQRSKPPGSAVSQETPGKFDSHVIFVIRSTPPVEKPKPKPRKRKQYFDVSLVLPSRFMKTALEHASGLLRKRKRLACSPLDVWILNINPRKEQIFFEPLVTGLCEDLHNTFREDPIPWKPHLAITEGALLEFAKSPAHMLREASLGPEVAESPTPMQIEQGCDYEGNPAGNHFTPASANELGSELDPGIVGTDSGTTLLPTTDIPTSAGTFGSDLETPIIFTEEREKTSFSDITELVNSSEEEPNFLETDGVTPTGSQGSRGVGTLSVRTRAVAQYLQNHSPVSPISEDPSGDLSLNKMLEGKTRKISARVFFEMLALKNYGLIDVEQEKPYGDITLKLTPKLSKLVP